MARKLKRTENAVKLKRLREGMIKDKKAGKKVKRKRERLPEDYDQIIEFGEKIFGKQI